MANNKYKLTYFDWTGLAEITRLIFAYAKVPYEDDRIPIDDHFPILAPEWKAKTPWGQVPVLEVNGQQLAQARAINRYLAKQFKLAGSNDFESAKCDEIVDAFMDYTVEFQKYFREMDSTKKPELLKEVLEIPTPKYLTKFNEIVDSNGGKFLVGNSLTWADFVVHHLLTYFEDFIKIDLYKNYPALKNGKEYFYGLPAIKNWMETRPKPGIDFTDELFQEIVKKRMQEAAQKK